MDMAEKTAGNNEIVPSVDKPEMLSLIEQLACDPRFDAAKFEALLRLQRDIKQEERMDAAKAAYAVAMVEAQSEIEPVARTTQNTQTDSWYAKLEDIEKAIRPIYLRHGFTVSYDSATAERDGNIRIRGRCRHIGGYHEDFYREAPPDTTGPRGTPTKTMLHGGASTETFLKRYLLCGIFNVTLKNMDDDGNAGGQMFVTQEQCDQLTIMANTIDSPDGLCKFMKVASISQILAKDYEKARQGLENKAKFKARQEAERKQKAKLESVP